MAAPPTGTVSLLFTDIEGSTRLWETHADAMRAALARHDRLLRQCIEDRRGHIFKTGGDAFCAAFFTAADALAAALDGQRALAREPWPEGARLRVRMALHAGAVECRDGDYFGPPLNRVARLLSAAHGGQAVLSEAAYELARDQMPPLASARPLGTHGLKDLGRPETVYQLCHPDLAPEFPPLRLPGAAPDPGTNAPSIAVLPFVNMSRDDENEYFADGLAEELLNVLAKMRGLRVASRTSAFSFKGKEVDIPTVARKLNVATVLEGSVRKSGKRVRITAQLIEVATDSHLWSETYDRELDDIFAVQDDIAQSVVKELRETLLGKHAAADPGTAASAQAEVRHAVVGRSDNPEAFELYLQAKFFGTRLTQPDTDRAIALFERAIAIDPAFALAWAELSEVHQKQAGYGFAPIEAGFERAREAARRALAIAPGLAEAHLALAGVLQAHDWNWAAAEASYRRALELAPGSARAVRYAAIAAKILGRLDEALALMQQSLTLDPLSVATHNSAAILWLWIDDADRAAEHCRLALDLDPHAALSHAIHSAALQMQGRPEEALAEAEREEHRVFRCLALAYRHYEMGHTAEADAALRELIDDHGWTAAYQVAMVYAGRNDADHAFEWLERAFDQRDPGVPQAAGDPWLRPLHGDPRWAAFVKRLGFAPAAEPLQESDRQPGQRRHDD